MTLTDSPHQNQPVARAGQPLSEAAGAMILVHGRGATAASILQLSAELAHPSLSYLAPQAAGNTWYPYSFLAPIAQNQPGLDSGLARLAALVAEVAEAGIPPERLVLAGFSQGACLSAEFVARNPRRYGGLLVFSGGVIGPPGQPRQDDGDLAGTPVFIGCSDVDPHIPLTRVQETSAILRTLGGQVVERIYPGMPHTIIQPEIDEARQIVSNLLNE